MSSFISNEHKAHKDFDADGFAKREHLKFITANTKHSNQRDAAWEEIAQDDDRAFVTQTSK